MKTGSCKAEQIASQANDADQAETYASLECTDLRVSRGGSVYTFKDGSTLVVRGHSMNWKGGAS